MAETDVLIQTRRSLRAEWGKTWSVLVPALWLLAAVVGAGLVAASLANDLVHGIATGERPPGSTMPTIDAVGPALGFAQIAVTAFGLHLVTPEYASGSIGPTLLAQPRRYVVVLAKTVVALLSGAAIGAVVGPLAEVGVRAVLGDASGSTASLGVVALGAAVVFGVAAVLGVAVAFMLRSAVGALCVCALLLLASLAAPEAIGRWLPGPAGAQWLDGLTSGAGWLGPGLVLVAWALGVTAVAAWLLRRRDA